MDRSIFYGLGISGDGCLKDRRRYDVTIGIEEPDEERPMLFPNPAMEEVSISGTGPMRATGAELFDPQGRSLCAYSTDDLASPLPLNGLGAGALLLVVRTGRGVLRLPFMHLAEQ